MAFKTSEISCIKITKILRVKAILPKISNYNVFEMPHLITVLDPFLGDLYFGPFLVKIILLKL